MVGWSHQGTVTIARDDQRRNSASQGAILLSLIEEHVACGARRKVTGVSPLVRGVINLV